MKLKTIVLLACAAISSAAAAQESTHFIVHGVSHHFHARPGGGQWQEVNQGIGIRYAFDQDFALQGDIARNSLDRMGVYAIADYTPLHLGPLRLGVFGGVATGYIYSVTPVGGIVLRLEAGPLTPTLRLVPKMAANKSAVLILEVGIKF